jgi:asparagine synthetase B (glutamine-hydrolysing)
MPKLLKKKKKLVTKKKKVLKIEKKDFLPKEKLSENKNKNKEKKNSKNSKNSMKPLKKIKKSSNKNLIKMISFKVLPSNLKNQNLIPNKFQLKKNKKDPDSSIKSKSKI